MSRWIVPDDLDVWPDEDVEGGSHDAIPRDWIRIMTVPTHQITGMSSEPRDPSQNRGVRSHRRRLREEAPMPPATLTLRLPLKGDALDAHIDGAHRAQAARLEGLKTIPLAIVFLDRESDEAVEPPRDWEVTARDYLVESDIRRESYFAKMHEDNEQFKAEQAALGSE